MTCDLTEEKVLTGGRFGGTASLQGEKQMYKDPLIISLCVWEKRVQQLEWSEGEEER